MPNFTSPSSTVGQKTVRLNGESLEIKFPYSLYVKIKTAILGLPDRKWSPTKKMWTTPATSWHSKIVHEALLPHDFEFDPAATALALGETYKSQAAKIKKRFPKLYPYQVEAVDFLLRSKGRGIIGDDIGLGKTPETLAYLSMVNARRRILVISPASMTYQWQSEFEKWLGWPSLVVADTKTTLPPHDIPIIMSYSIARLKRDDIERWKPSVVIADEAHYLKDRRTLQAKAVVSFSRSAEKVLLLSGTPFKSRVSELWSLLNTVDPGSWPEYFQFLRRYCDGYADNPNVTNEDELTDRIKDIMIRRTKQQVAAQLPKLARSKIKVNMSAAALRDYDSAMTDLYGWLQKNGRSVAGALYAQALVKINVLRRLMGLAKVPVAVDWAKNFLTQQPDRKLIIFAIHKDVVSSLVSGLKDYDPLTITGSVIQSDRDRNKQEFQNGRRRVMIISEAGGEGINLFAASDILFVERSWTPADEEQIEGRAHRTGQTRNVMAWYLVGPHIDEKMDALIDSKRELFKRVVGADVVKTMLTELVAEMTGKEVRRYGTDD